MLLPRRHSGGDLLHHVARVHGLRSAALPARAQGAPRDRQPIQNDARKVRSCCLLALVVSADSLALMSVCSASGPAFQAAIGGGMTGSAAGSPRLQGQTGEHACHFCVAEFVQFDSPRRLSAYWRCRRRRNRRWWCGGGRGGREQPASDVAHAAFGVAGTSGRARAHRRSVGSLNPAQCLPCCCSLLASFCFSWRTRSVHCSCRSVCRPLSRFASSLARALATRC